MTNGWAKRTQVATRGGGVAVALALALLAAGCSGDDDSSSPGEPTTQGTLTSTTETGAPASSGAGGPISTTLPLVEVEAPSSGAELVADAGPGPLGDIPSGAVRVAVGDDLPALVEGAEDGTTFVIESGVHRLTRPIRPGTGMRFLGEPDAVLSGAEVVEGWSEQDGAWEATVDPVERTGQYGMCRDEPDESCTYSEDLFVDDVLQRRVLDRDDVESGTWYLDDDGVVVLGTDPGDALVELSREGVAFHTDAATASRDVEIRNLTIEKFGVPAQQAAIAAEDSNGGWHQAADPTVDTRGGWVIAHNLVRWNHGGGIYAGTGSQVVANRVIENGQIGIKAAGPGGLIEGNEIAGNNTIGFQHLWEAGGAKFWNARDLTVAGNWVHDNDGSGLWADYALPGVIVAGNVAEDNRDSGINIEMTVGTQVVGNLVIGNDIGDRANPGYWSGGIFLFNTPEAVVTGNVLRDNVGGIIVQAQQRGCIDPEEEQGAGLCKGDAPSGTSRDVVVDGNDITMTEGVTGMIVIASSDFPPYAEQDASFAEALYAEPAARFSNNVYRGTGYESSAGDDDQFSDVNHRFVWGFPHGFATDPDNVYTFTTRRFLGFDDWVRYARPDGDRLVS